MGIIKVVKGGVGCGALALNTDGYLYGCGKNKNQMFGR
jgi:alpha-tubulin suppressor-like RCC1 family protein